MKLFLSAVFLVLVSLSPLAPAWALGALDGKIFAAQTADKAKGADGAQPDTLEFANGKFSSALCVKSGYGPGKYTATAQNTAFKFEALAVNKAGGKMKWSGMIRGQDIEGTCVTTESGKVRESWFKGRLK